MGKGLAKLLTIAKKNIIVANPQALKSIRGSKSIYAELGLDCVNKVS